MHYVLQQISECEGSQQQKRKNKTFSNSCSKSELKKFQLNEIIGNTSLILNSLLILVSKMELKITYLGLSDIYPNYIFELESDAFELGDIDWDYCRGNKAGEWWATYNQYGAARLDNSGDRKYRYEINKNAGNSTNFAMIFRVGGQHLLVGTVSI